MEQPEGKVILTRDQIPSFLALVRRAVGQQSVAQMTVAEMTAFVQGASLVFMSVEQALVGATQNPGPDAGLPGNDQQQRPV
jgi:hypothetical protein